MAFIPTDEELITFYLLPKSLNLKLHSGIISDLDIYKYEPHQLQDFAFDHGNGRMYFFSPLKMKNKDGSGTRGDRVVAGRKGCWKATQKRDTVLSSKNEEIGTKQSLVYHTAKWGKTSWLMTEYRFLDESEYNNKASHKLALCVIYYNHKKGGSEASSRNDDGEVSNFTIDELPNTDCIQNPRLKRKRKSSSSISAPNSDSIVITPINSISANSFIQKPPIIGQPSSSKDYFENKSITTSFSCPSDQGHYRPPVCATGSMELECVTGTKVNEETMTDDEFCEILSYIFD
ncbi:unnamed protein product [Cuscuta epithymum]|uniref:NAC domain-containing protein n=1 Tax=Cuscuta epithymum TaxID=186058 RepID=A0AAV0FGC4_9ASTE|nr:unnamed protein product [Cuscuta epithymum]